METMIASPKTGGDAGCGQAADDDRPASGEDEHERPERLGDERWSESLVGHGPTGAR